MRTLEVVGVEEQEPLRRGLLADGDVHAAAHGCRSREQLPVLLCDVICAGNQQTSACTLMHGKDRSEVSAMVGDGAPSPLRALTLAVGGCSRTRWVSVPASASFASTNTCHPSWMGCWGLPAFLVRPIQ